MTIRKLEESEWQSYFDEVSRAFAGHADSHVAIEIVSPDLGDQIAAGPLSNQVEPQWPALRGITYDPRSNVLEVIAESLDHMVRQPREIYVDETDGGLVNVEAMDGEGNKQIVTLKPPLPLPAAAH